MKWICDGCGECHIICQEGEDWLVKEQCLISYISLVICLVSFMQESLGSSWLMWVSFWDSGQWVFELMGILVRDRPWIMLNSSTHCLPARRYLVASWSSLGNILTSFYAQRPSPDLFSCFPVVTKVSINRCFIDLHAFSMEYV